jgi:hypothetical protein
MLFMSSSNSSLPVRQFLPPQLVCMYCETGVEFPVEDDQWKAKPDFSGNIRKQFTETSGKSS